MFKKLMRPVLIALVLLFVILNITSYDKKFNALIEVVDNNNQSSYKFTCRIVDYPMTTGNKVKTYAEVLSSNYPVNITDRKLLIQAPKTYLYDLQYGCKIGLSGNISEAPDALNKGSFDYRKYLESKNTIGIFNKDENDEIRYLGKSTGIVNVIYGIRSEIITTLKKHFRGDEAGLIIAMLTGERGFISDNMNDAYKKAGIFHIVSVSGLHAGIFISLISFALLFIPMRNARKKLFVRFTGVCIGVVLYLFTDFGISITRVIFMLAVMSAAFLIRREYNILTAIPFAAVLILLILPGEFFNQSFQLTFLSTYGLCAALKLCEGKIPQNTFGQYLLLPLAISVGATLATLHISVYNYRMIPILGILTNLIAVPLSSFLLCAVVAFSLAAPLLPESAASLLSVAVYIPTKLLNELSLFIARLDFSYITVMPGIFFIGSVIITGAFISLYAFIRRKKLTGTLVLTFTVVFFGFVMYNVNTPDTKITFINAGKGESVVIQTPDGKATVVDCGSVSASDSAENVFIPYFSHAGISKIDKLVISYFDDEHTNAITALMRDGYVKELVLPPEINVTKEKILFNRRKIIDAAKKYSVKYSHIYYDESISAGNGASIYLHSENSTLKDKNACAIYSVCCGKISFLLSSCLGAKGQELLAQKTIDCTVLKTPNYGQTVKATENYILSSKPEYAVITTPANDRYISFDSKLDDIMNKGNIPYARTDTNKTVTFITDGKIIKSVKTWKGELN